MSDYRWNFSEFAVAYDQAAEKNQSYLFGVAGRHPAKPLASRGHGGSSRGHGWRFGTAHGAGAGQVAQGPRPGPRPIRAVPRPGRTPARSLRRPGELRPEPTARRLAGPAFHF